MPSLGLEFETVDVFTTTRYAGNPLAIVRIPHGRASLGQEEKQKIAKEFNLSETVFLHEASQHETAEWKADIFLTSNEIPWAGHPTVGTACMLGARFPELQGLTLVLKAGPAKVTLSGSFSEDGYRRASCEIPHTVHVHKAKLPSTALNELQPDLSRVLDSRCSEFPVVSIVKGVSFVLVDVGTRNALSKVARPPHQANVEMDKDWETKFLGMYFYCVDPELDSPSKRILHTRMLEPSIEDPATGSAACALCAHLAQRSFSQAATLLEIDFLITQGEHMGRKSTIEVKVVANQQGSIDKVFLSGMAVPVMSGTL